MFVLVTKRTWNSSASAAASASKFTQWYSMQSRSLKAHSHRAIARAGAVSVGMGHRPIWFFAASDITLVWCEWYHWYQ